MKKYRCPLNCTNLEKCETLFARLLVSTKEDKFYTYGECGKHFLIERNGRK